MPAADIEAPYIDSNSGAYVDKSESYTLESVYSMDIEKFRRELYGTFVFATCLFSVLVILRWYNMTLRDTRYFSHEAMQRQVGVTDYYWYFEIACLICHSYNIIIFPFTGTPFVVYVYVIIATAFCNYHYHFFFFCFCFCFFQLVPYNMPINSLILFVPRGQCC